MRFGVELPRQDHISWARRADRLGLAFVVVTAPPGAECATAAAVALATTDVRVVVRVALGHEHPVTVVEEINVFDNIAGGRAVALFTAHGLDPEQAREELDICRLAGTQRAFAYDGAHWRVPARLPEHEVPSTLMVTPPPTQIVVPLWAEGDLPSVPGVTHVASRATDVGDEAVAPASLRITGDLETDRRAAETLRDAGATHCIVGLDEAEPVRDIDWLVRWVTPESAMVAFPRVVAEVNSPAEWPGEAPVERPNT